LPQGGDKSGEIGDGDDEAVPAAGSGLRPSASAARWTGRPASHKRRIAERQDGHRRPIAA